MLADIFLWTPKRVAYMRLSLNTLYLICTHNIVFTYMVVRITFFLLSVGPAICCCSFAFCIFHSTHFFFKLMLKLSFIRENWKQSWPEKLFWKKWAQISLWSHIPSIFCVTLKNLICERRMFSNIFFTLWISVTIFCCFARQKLQLTIRRNGQLSQMVSTQSGLHRCINGLINDLKTTIDNILHCRIENSDGHSAIGTR